MQVNRPLRDEFSTVLDGLPWDVALLQEAPPTWHPALRERCSAVGALGLTSRNELGRLRALAARANPDLIASNEGGSNMVLVRAPGSIEEVRHVRLATRPERRALLLARVAPPGGTPLAVACMHLSVGSTGTGVAEVERAARLAVDYAGDLPLLFGGDLNLREREHPDAFARLREQFGLAGATAPGAIDHLLVRGLGVLDAPMALPAEARELRVEGARSLRLSDHAPVVGRFEVR